MINQHHSNKLLGAVLTILSIGLSTQVAYGMGLSPVDIIVNDILPNSSVTKELYISRGDASEEEIAIVTI